MAELARHIEVLLLDNDCVIVPDFGGFMAHHVAAKYIEDEELFLPPSRTLGFNPQLKINDSLLAQSYVDAYDISYPEALRRIEDDVNEMQQALDNNGSYELNNIGILTVTSEGQYDFQPCSCGIITPALYALNSLDFPTLGSTREEQPIDEHPTTKLQQSVIGIENSTKIAFPVEETEEESPRVISINVSTIRHMMTAAAVLLFFILVSAPLGEKPQSDIKKCSVDSSILTRIMPGLEVQGDIPELLVPKDTMNQTTESTDQQATTTDTTTNYYAIVLASQVLKDNAERYVSKLKNEGITDARVLEHGNKRKVICGNYATDAEAQEAVREIRQYDGLQDAWVMHVK